MLDQNKNKILSILLIILISFLFCFLFPDDFGYIGRLLSSIPVLTILLAIYAYIYGFKRLITKIVFILLIISSIVVLSLTWYVYELAKGMRSH